MGRLSQTLLIPRRRTTTSDWVAQLVAHSPIALYAADRGVYSDAGTTPAVNSDPVRQWNDQSGNGYHLSQATLGNRPTLVTAYQNSLSAVLFDGSDDYMLSSAFQAFPSKRGVMVMAFKNTIVNGTGVLAGNYSAAAVDFVAYSTITGAINNWYDDVVNYVAAVADNNNSVIKSWHRDGDTSLKHRRNGAAADTYAVTDNQPSNAALSLFATTGGTSLMKGYCFMLAFFSDKTLAQVQAIEAIVNTAWAIY